MNLKIKNVWYLVVCMFLFIYGCSSDDYNYGNEMESVNGAMQTRALSSKAMEYTLMDSIAESDEFLDFRIHCMNLAEKLKLYTSTLSKEEYDEFMNNLNNDDYMLDVIDEIDIKKEMLLVENSRTALLDYEGFQRLDESEKMDLFMIGFDKRSHVMLKNRGEGGVTKAECKRRLDEDYAYASAVYLAAMVACSCATGGIGVCFCAIAASAAYDYAITLADRSYYDCMSNAIDG